MKQVYYPYDKWEEVSYGMYATEVVNADKLIEKAVSLLSQPELLKKYMKDTTIFWKYSTERNMTCSSLNKQAWLGQAACCLKDNVPADLTKQAWSLLTDKQREEANAVADEIIAEWVEDYAKNI